MKPPVDYGEPRREHSLGEDLADHYRPTKKEAFDRVYGDKQLNFIVLGTQPGYQRRGAASSLPKLGMQKARDESLTVTLFASLQGLGLYKKSGCILSCR